MAKRSCPHGYSPPSACSRCVSGSKVVHPPGQVFSGSEARAIERAGAVGEGAPAQGEGTPHPTPVPATEGVSGGSVLGPSSPSLSSRPAQPVGPIAEESGEAWFDIGADTMPGTESAALANLAERGGLRVEALMEAGEPDALRFSGKPADVLAFVVGLSKDVVPVVHMPGGSVVERRGVRPPLAELAERMGPPGGVPVEPARCDFCLEAKPAGKEHVCAWGQKLPAKQRLSSDYRLALYTEDGAVYHLVEMVREGGLWREREVALPDSWDVMEAALLDHVVEKMSP